MTPNEEYLILFEILSNPDSFVTITDESLNTFRRKISDHEVEENFWLLLFESSQRHAMQLVMLQILSVYRKELHMKIIDEITAHKKLLYAIA